MTDEKMTVGELLGVYRSPAKINLGLQILFKRPDGYHELNTVFHKVQHPHDTIEVRKAEVFSLTTTDPSLPVDGSNLIMKAVKAYAHQTKQPLPKLHLHLVKHIPQGAGLGGGSSDAATTLKILNAHSSRSVRPEALHQIGCSLGADVPFFLLDCQSATATGIGTELTPVTETLPFHILVAYPPNIRIATREAYAWLGETISSQQLDFMTIFRPEKRGGMKLTNDFELSVFKRHKELYQIKQALIAKGAHTALLSGSGSALFGLFEDMHVMLDAHELLREEGIMTALNPADD